MLAATGGGCAPAEFGRVLEVTGLSEVAGRKVRAYSQGMRQRLGLAAAMLGRPPLLIIDEPTNGLDPAGIREVRGLLGDLAASGTAVFMSSHLLAEVEQVCDRVAVIVRGRSSRRAAVAARRHPAPSPGPGRRGGHRKSRPGYWPAGPPGS